MTTVKMRIILIATFTLLTSSFSFADSILSEKVMGNYIRVQTEGTFSGDPSRPKSEAYRMAQNCPALMQVKIDEQGVFYGIRLQDEPTTPDINWGEDNRLKAGAILWYEKSEDKKEHLDGAGDSKFVKAVTWTEFTANSIHHEEQGYIKAIFWIPAGTSTRDYIFNLQNGTLEYSVDDHNIKFTCLYKK